MTPGARLWTVTNRDGDICRRWALTDQQADGYVDLLFAAVVRENVLAELLIGPDGSIRATRREAMAMIDDPCPRCGGGHDRIDRREPCPTGAGA